MKIGFSETILLAAIFLILLGPSVIPRLQRWLRRANHTRTAAQKAARRAKTRAKQQLAAQRDYYLHRFAVAGTALVLIMVLGWGWYLLFDAVPAEPAAFEAPAQTLQLSAVGGGEALTLDLAPYKAPTALAWQDGWLYAAVTGPEGGAVVRLRPQGTAPAPVLTCAGQITGLAFAPDGLLYLSVVGDTPAETGVFSARFDGLALGLTPVVQQLDGTPLAYPAALAVSQAGLLYFTAYTALDPAELGSAAYGHYTELLAHTGSGSAWVYDPSARTAAQLTGGLQGAGGIALAPDGQTVYLSETGCGRLWAVDAACRGTDITADAKLLCSGLTGYPAALAAEADGTLWAALCGARIGWLDKTGPLPFVRRIAMNLPGLTQRWLLTPDENARWAAALDTATGKPRQACRVTSKTGRLTGVCLGDGRIWLADPDAGCIYGTER